MAPYAGPENLSFQNQLIGLLYAFTGIGGITGNIIILITFLKERSRSYFHIQLAVVNIVYLTCIALAGPSALRGRWMFGDTWCQLYSIHVFTLGNVYFALICAICIESYAAICYKHWYERRSGTAYLAVSAVVWIYSLFFGLAPYFGWNSYAVESYGGTSCGINLDEMNSNHSSYLWTASGILLVIMLIAVVSLVNAFRESRTDEKQFSPLLNDRELVKVSTGLLVMAVFGSILYSYRVFSAVALKPYIFGFMGVELSHIALKLAAALCPFSYYLFGSEFKALTQSLITGVDPEKKMN